MNKRTSRVTLYCLIDIQCLCFCSCSKSISYNKIDKYDICNKNFTDTIPIRFVHNRILVPVTIKGYVYSFVFDTGSYSFALYNEDLKSECDSIGSLKITGANDIRKKGTILKVPDLKIDKLELKDCPMTALNTHTFQCADFDGLIGTNILKNKILKIDTRKGIIILTDHDNFFNGEKGDTIPFETYRTYIPFFSVTPINKNKERIFIDTGSPFLYTISYKYYNKLMKKKIQLPIADTGSGNVVGGIWGNGKDTTCTKFQLNNFALGGLSIHNVKAATYNSKISSLGSEILNHCSLIMDYIHSRLIFIPYNGKDTIDSKYDFPSLSIMPDKDKIKIRFVWKNSDAYRAGLRSGFIVKSVNGISTQNVCDFRHQWENMKGNITMECLDLKNNPVTFHLVK